MSDPIAASRYILFVKSRDKYPLLFIRVTMEILQKSERMTQVASTTIDFPFHLCARFVIEIQFGWINEVASTRQHSNL